MAPQSVQDIIGLLHVRVADHWDSVCREFDRSARTLSHDLPDFSGIRFTWTKDKEEELRKFFESK
jgi:hypothetical protein